MVNLNTGIMFFRIHLHALFGVGSFTTMSACAPTAYEVIRDCQKFEKH
jgi:hypothetical protein